MNRRIVLLGLPLVLLVSVVAGISSLPRAHASGFPSGPGTICLLDSSASISASPPGPCATVGPYTFSGPYPSTPQTGPTQIRVGVYVNGSAGLDAFAITLVSDSSILQPVGVDLTGTVLLGTPQVLVECFSDVLIQGTSCSSVDNGNTLEFAASSALGQPLTAAPTTGLLFTAIYNIVGSTSGPISIGFQTGCGTTTSVSDGSCVTIANGSTSPDSELLQGASFDNSVGNSVLSWYYELASSNVVTVPLNAASGTEVNLTASAPNGFPVLGGTTVVFSTSTTPGFGSPNFFGNPTYMCSAFAGALLTCGTELTFSTSTAGSYDVTVYMSYVGDNCADSGPCTATYSLVGTTVIQVNVQAVAWSIDSVSSSKAQTVYMADGASNPMSIIFIAQSLGGYTGTITYQTNTLTDGGTGITFSYPASFLLGAGQTISQTVTATAATQGTALYQAALVTTGPTLTNQSSAVLTIHVTGFSIVAVFPTVSFAAFGSGSDSITLQSLPASTAGFAGKALLSHTVSGGPLTVTCPASLTLTAGGTVSGTCTFSGTVAGVYNVAITGTGGTNNAITNSTTILVTVTSTAASFSITASPNSASGLVNSTLVFQLSITSQGGLGGTVTLSYSSSPSSGITCGFSNTGIPLPSGTSTLSCSSPNAGTSAVTVNGVEGSHTASATIMFTFTDFSVTASPTVVTTTAGVSGGSAIAVTPLSGFAGTVTLTDTVAPPGLSCSMSLTTVVLGSATISNLSCSGSVGVYVVTVTGLSGAVSRTTTVNYIVNPATPSLTTLVLNVAGAPVTSVTAGSTVYDQAILIGGYPPTGVTGTVSYAFYEDANCAPPGTPEGTVIVGPGNSVGPSNPVLVGPPGSYSFQATYSGDPNNTPVVGPCEQLMSTDFALTSTPSTVATTQGVPGTSAIAVVPINGFTDTVALTDSVSPSGLACTLVPASISGGSGSSTLSCTGVGGTYAVTVTGTDGGLSHSTIVTVNVQDFTLSAVPSSLTLTIGPPAGTTMITVAPLGGFTGAVSLTALAPAGFSTIFAPSTITIAGTSLLTIGVSPPATPGTYLVNVTGTSGDLTHTVTITVTVTSASGVLPPVVTQGTWEHRFSLSKYADVQIWRFGVQNNSTSTTIYFAVTISGTDGSSGAPFTLTSQVHTLKPQKNIVNLSLSQSFNTSELGDTFAFNMVIHWGTTATSDPSQLPFTSVLTNGAPTSGTFTVLQ